MARRRAAAVRDIAPDYKHGSVLISQFINSVMLCGKKSIAQKIVYGAIDLAVERIGGIENVATWFDGVVQCVRPSMEVKSRRVGGSTYQIPIQVRERRSYSLALRWIIHAARLRNGKTMILRLADELVDVGSGKGGATKKRDEKHRMAESNKAFSHYG